MQFIYINYVYYEMFGIEVSIIKCSLLRGVSSISLHYTQRQFFYIFTLFQTYQKQH